MVKYGFAIHGLIDYVGSPRNFTLEDFKKIKSWGFNYIAPYTWWFYYEPDLSRVGYYPENRWNELRRIVDLAKQAGLRVILQFRVAYDSGSGWWVYEAPYANETEEGRNRYANFIEEMVRRFPDCDYTLWQMPYHGQSCSAEAQKTYNTVTVPTLLARVRRHSNNTVVIVPIHQNPSNLPSTPWSDSNIIYGLGHVVIGSVSWGKNAWNGETSEIDAKIEVARQYKARHNVELMSIEYGGIGFDSLPIDQSRLDCLDYTCKKMQELGAGWMYHCISKKVSSDTILTDLSAFIPEPNLLSLLQKYNVQSEPPHATGCFIATACGTSNAHLDTLRSFRDRYLPNGLVDAYYLLSPPVADRIRRHENVKTVIRGCVEWSTCRLKKSLTL